MASAPLLSSEAPNPPLTRLEDSPVWRLCHASGFLLGGGTFCVGTLALVPFAQDSATQSLGLQNLSAGLYTLGSLGFLSVDVLEFFTFTGDALLRANISLSLIGSLLYVVGSVGFAPSVAAAWPALGGYGFLLGSAFIAGSQAWKVARLARAPAPPPPPHPALDVPLALGVEGGAGLGAAFFLAGTALYMGGWAAGGQWAAVLWLWAAGSVGFSAGGVCLWWRHYVLGLA